MREILNRLKVMNLHFPPPNTPLTSAPGSSLPLLLTLGIAYNLKIRRIWYHSATSVQILERKPSCAQLHYIGCFQRIFQLFLNYFTSIRPKLR